MNQNSRDIKLYQSIRLTINLSLIRKSRRQDPLDNSHFCRMCPEAVVTFAQLYFYRRCIHVRLILTNLHARLILTNLYASDGTKSTYFKCYASVLFSI